MMEREPDSTTYQQSWDDLCFDPHQSSLEEGKAQGREAGALAGFRDGQALGRTKGIEFGMELGFIRGFLSVLAEPTNDRIQRSMHELVRALEDFPGPDAMFEQVLKQQQQPATSSDKDDSEDPTKLDVIAKMQRIRARFKLLTVQLKIPHYSLKQVMDEAASHHKTTAEPPADNEW
jgi:hypothetical protein